MCYYSQLIKNPKYTANKKNGGVIPHMADKRVILVPIGCGDCKECRKATHIVTGKQIGRAHV